MEHRNLGPVESVSRLALGGGGIGQVWGETTREEALATVESSVAAGINFFDLAPMYGDGEAERVVGEALGGRYPEDVLVSTKCMLGDAPAGEIDARLRRSLDESCERLNRDTVTVYILHGCVVADGWTGAINPTRLARVAVPLSKYRACVVPAFRRLKEEGRIQAWGITCASVPDIDTDILRSDERPDVVQCITNVLNSSGSMAMTEKEADHRGIIRTAAEVGTGVMGIRAVAAGSLTNHLDREIKPASREQLDFDRAESFRAIAAELGISAADLAHQYALQMEGVDTVVLGVKNRRELNEAIGSESAQLTPHTIDRLAQLYG